MTRKLKTDNDVVVSPSAPAPAHRKSTRVRSKRAAVPAATPATELTATATPVSEPEVIRAQPAAPVTTYEPSRQEIAELAYLYWEARGCQGGSQEEDWLRAEQELRARAIAVTA
jgi:hypothetical protein